MCSVRATLKSSGRLGAVIETQAGMCVFVCVCVCVAIERQAGMCVCVSECGLI